MAKILNKQSSGLIEVTDFSGGITSPWILSPENSEIVIDTNGLTLKASAKDAGVYRVISESECVIDIYNDFAPENEVSKAIISIFENESLSLDIEEKFEEGTATIYPFIRIVKNHNSYSFYASNDFEDWEFLGSQDVELNTPKLGIKLVGDSTIDYVIPKIVIYKNTNISVRGVTEGNNILILDAEGTELISKMVLANKQSVSISNSKIEISDSVKIRIENNSGELITESELINLFGGDIYNYEYFVTILDEDNKIFVPDSFNYLGGISGDSIIRTLRILNDSGHDFSKVKVRILEKGDSTYTNIGVSVTENGQYKSEIDLSPVNNGTTKPFYLKAERDVSGSFTEIKFDLQIELE